ncbi:MAG: hypothetical protein ACK2UC_10330 [Anaerolineae bacterium]
MSHPPRFISSRGWTKIEEAGMELINDMEPDPVFLVRESQPFTPS